MDPFSSEFDSSPSTRRNSTGSSYMPRLQDKLGHSAYETTTSTPNNHESTLERDLKKENDDIEAYNPVISRPKLPLRQRLLHFTWAWYTLPMSTGGISLLLNAQPHRFNGLEQTGFIIYLINIFIFLTITATMGCRFSLNKGSFLKSITHSREGFFVPTLFLTIATLISNTEVYIIPHTDAAATKVIMVMFWLYVGTTLILAVGQYSYIFAKVNVSLQTMMPTWILPIFPIMLSGTIASVIADMQEDCNAIPIIVAGLTCQGLGLSVAGFMYAHMIGRLMQYGLPDREHRPGLFMCVGPPAFTAIALIGMAKALPDSFGKYSPDFDGVHLNPEVLRNIAVMFAVFLWALSLWWFAIALVSVLMSPPKYFHLGWWATVFPNTGFTLATIAIAKEFRSDAVMWVTTGMSILMILNYTFVLVCNIRAVWIQDIMYPGRDEDVADH